MPSHLRLSAFIEAWTASPFAAVDDLPWNVTQHASALILAAIGSLGSGYRIEDGRAVHETATIESGAVLKGPLIVGPGAFVAAGAYLRDGVFLAGDCIVGPGCELKTSFMFAGSKIAHLSFVGDSLLGSDVNIEAGAMIANYRNELDDKQIRMRVDEATIDTGVDKFGSLIGDRCRIGANAVLAPGTVLRPGVRIGRLQLVDQSAGI